MLPAITATALRRRLDEGSAILIDVREPGEYAREHIEGARLVPLSSFERHDIGCEQGKAIVFHCRSGARTTMNAARLMRSRLPEAYQLAGGIEAWKRAGLPTQGEPRAPIDLKHQLRLGAAGLLVAGGLAGAFLTPWAYLLCGFAGVGLIIAGTRGGHSLPPPA